MVYQSPTVEFLFTAFSVAFDFSLIDYWHHLRWRQIHILVWCVGIRLGHLQKFINKVFALFIWGLRIKLQFGIGKLLPVVIKSWWWTSTRSNISKFSSTEVDMVVDSSACNEFRVILPGPLPQSSYILATSSMSSITGTSNLIMNRAHCKYLRKSIVLLSF